jgi:hypothetical protein
MTATYTTEKTLGIPALNREGKTLYRLVIDGEEWTTMFPTEEKAKCFCAVYNEAIKTYPSHHAFDEAMETATGAEWSL